MAEIKKEAVEEGEFRGMVLAKLDYMASILNTLTAEHKEIYSHINVVEARLNHTMEVQKKEDKALFDAQQEEIEELKAWKNKFIGLGIVGFPVLSLLINYLFERITH